MVINQKLLEENFKVTCVYEKDTDKEFEAIGPCKIYPTHITLKTVVCKLEEVNIPIESIDRIIYSKEIILDTPERVPFMKTITQYADDREAQMPQYISVFK
jgi:hypothetical protein